MKVNRALCDWLTLTSFSDDNDLWKIFVILTPEPERRQTKRMQYSGSKGSHTFWGTGTQNGIEHTLFQASGETADVALDLAKGTETRCTRIDLQVTIDLFAGWDSRELYDGLADPMAEWNGRQKAVSIVQSGDGLDTVYIGSRKSSMLIRIYVKPSADGRPAYLRFECEYKGDKADGVYRAIVEGKYTPESILQFELHRLPELEFGLSGRFSDVIRAVPGAPSPKTDPGQSDTIDWLLRQVEPAVIRLLHDHEHGARMERILTRWLGNSPVD